MRRAEATFQAALARALNAPLRTTRVWRQFAGKVQSVASRAWVAGAPAGAADLTGYVSPSGVRLEIECKAASGSQSADQRRWAGIMGRAGVIYVCVYDLTDAPIVVSVAAAVARVDQAIAKRRAKPVLQCG